MIYWLVYCAGLVLALLTSAHAVLRKRDPRAAGLWVTLSFLLPIVGPFAYYVFGINRTQRRARRRMSGYRFRTRGGGRRKAEEYPPQVGHLERLARLGDRILSNRLVDGNLIEPLHNGEQAYPAMLEAIASAKRSVTCSSYIFDYDEIGRRFIDAFADAAARGVQVRLLIDGVGGWWYFSRVRRAFKKAGIKPANFAPIGLAPSRLVHVNLRNHRKILVIDGQTAFTGGMNISACHLAERTDNPDRFVDMHFRARGPIVGQIQEAFADDWYFAAQEWLEGNDFFPALQPAGEAVARGIPDGPDEHLRKISWIIIGACAAARRSVRIMTPYFIPDIAVKTAILGAALRGVDVTIVIPQKSDVPVVNWASIAYLWEFLERGVTIVQHAPPFHHTKLLVVDERWSTIGSANVDPRSLRLNFEFNVEVYDTGLARTLARHIDEQVAAGKRLTLAEVDGRRLHIRMRDALAKLFSPYL